MRRHEAHQTHVGRSTSKGEAPLLLRSLRVHFKSSHCADDSGTARVSQRRDSDAKSGLRCNRAPLP